MPDVPSVKPRAVSRKLLHYTLHLPVATKVPCLLAMVVVLSAVASLDLSPYSWLAEPRNPINTHLLKWSWGWTLLCLCPSVMLTAFLYTGLDWRAALQHLARLLVAHCIWYCTTSVFVLVDSAVGTCEGNSESSRSACIRRGHTWTGFDISGHVFLLTYCVFALTEEAASLRAEVWNEYEASVQRERHRLHKQPNLENLLLWLHQLCSPFSRCLELLAAALVLLWTVMAGMTCLYFHSFPEKMVGFACSYLAWYLTYCKLYSVWPYTPSKPEEALLHPLKH